MIRQAALAVDGFARSLGHPGPRQAVILAIIGLSIGYSVAVATGHAPPPHQAAQQVVQALTPKEVVPPSPTHSPAGGSEPTHPASDPPPTASSTTPSTSPASGPPAAGPAPTSSSANLEDTGTWSSGSAPTPTSTTTTTVPPSTGSTSTATRPTGTIPPTTTDGVAVTQPTGSPTGGLLP